MMVRDVHPSSSADDIPPDIAEKDGVTMKRFLSSLVPALVALLWASTASAQAAASTPVVINATVAKSCSAATTSDLSGGVFNPITQAGGTSTGTVTVSCSKGVNVLLAASAGGNAASAPNSYTRALKSTTLTTAEYIGYRLWMTPDGGGANLELTADSAQKAWGKATGRTTPVNVTLSAVLDSSRDPSADVYTDTVTVDVYVN